MIGESWLFIVDIWTLPGFMLMNDRRVFVIHSGHSDPTWLYADEVPDSGWGWSC